MICDTVSLSYKLIRSYLIKKMKNKAQKNQKQKLPATSYKLQANGGFSMLEFVVVISIMLVMTIAVASFQQDIIKTNRTSQEGLRAQQELRRVLTDMKNEIRNARTSAVGSYVIESATGDSLVFFSDYSGDGVPERMRYFYEESELKRGIKIPSGTPLSYDGSIETIDTVARYVMSTTTPLFSYFDGSYAGDGSSLTLPLDVGRIRMVRISISVDKDPASPPDPITVGTSATIRELKDNL